MNACANIFPQLASSLPTGLDNDQISAIANNSRLCGILAEHGLTSGDLAEYITFLRDSETESSGTMLARTLFGASVRLPDESPVHGGDGARQARYAARFA